MVHKSTINVNGGGGGGTPGGSTGQVQVNAGGGAFGGTSNPLFRTIGVTVDGGGSVPATGAVARFITIPYSGTITGWTLESNAPGSVVVDVWKRNAAIPTIANTIVASAPPTLASQQYVNSTTLTGWTTAVTAGDVFGFSINSATTITAFTLQINITTN